MDLNNATVKESVWDFKSKEDFVDEWFLMSSPVPVAMIAVSYLLFVLKVGPQFMKNRQPFQLKTLLLFYNFGQVFVSLYLFVFGFNLLLPQGLVHRTCVLSRENMKALATGMYFYFLAKVSELLDTVFFVLRKKHDQVTFLHVYHHTMMMILTWLTLKYEPTYAIVFLGTINSFIHIVMYTYYGLSAIPEISKYLWWKKYITSMQLIQFMAIIVQAGVNYKYSGCPPSYLLLYMVCANAALFLYLFADFYIKAYMKNPKKKSEALNGKTEKANKEVTFANDIVSDKDKCHEKVQ